MAGRNFGAVGGLALLFGLAACASAPLGRSVLQEVRVETPGCQAMRCELRNDRGAWIVEATPGSVAVTTSSQPLEVRCLSPQAAAVLTRSPADQAPSAGSAKVVGAAVGGGIAAAVAAPAFVVGGPFALLGATLVVIGATSGGAIGHVAEASRREFAYPAVVQVAMSCASPTAQAASPAGANWGLVVHGAREGDGAPTGAVWIAAVAPGGRAAAAGLQAGDLLLAIDGRPLDGTLGLEQVLARLQGPATLALRRGSETIQLTLLPPGSP